MRCPKCGFENNDSAKTCAKCGEFINPRDEAKKRHRKVVQLPSNQAADETAPIDTDAVSKAVKPQSNSTDATNKIPTPRRRSGATGKIPAIKHPTHEDGKIPAEERKSSQAADQTQRASRQPRTKQTIIDDAVLAAETSTRVREPLPSRNRDYTAGSRRRVNEDNRTNKQQSRTKAFIIAVAILIIVALCALGLFFVNTGIGDKTVRFDTNGGTLIGNQYVLPDDELSKPANPTRPGYVFDGWYLDENFKEEAQFPLMITQDMTLYAKWKEETKSTNQIDSTTPSETATAPQESAQPSTNENTSSSSRPNSSSNSGNASNSKPSGGSNAGASSESASKPSTSGSSSGGNAINSNPASNGKVEVTVTALNGRKLTGTVTLHDGYVIPDSSKKAYTIAELKALNLNAAELCIARNEIYAREGYSFLSSDLQAYFNARSWYHNKGWRGQLPEGSAAYITAHNLLALAKENPDTAAWTSLLHR